MNKSGGIIDALDDVEYEGSVISLIDNGEAFIKRNTKMMWRKTANSREEMPDGSIIQDRDPLTVPSTRRNPVLADEFNRLGYMERKGSGSGKILSGYEFQINYNDKKRPSFRSDRYQFTVIMPNLNYDVPHDELDIRIIDFIRKDSKISTDKMAALLGISSKTVKRHIKKMNNVHYVGRGFSGHWEIIE